MNLPKVISTSQLLQLAGIRNGGMDETWHYVSPLGYTNVYWYRGGREAWEVAGLPETDLEVQDW
jgi:hypothetical protein